MLEQYVIAQGMRATEGKQVLAAPGYFLDRNDWGAGLQPHSTKLYYQPLDGKVTPLFGHVSDYSGVAPGTIGAPGCIFGKKPWMLNSTTPLLPRKVSELQEFKADYAWRAEADENAKFNVVVDVWLCRDAACHDDTIAAELMIWFHKQGMVPTGGPIGPGLYKGTGEKGWPVYSFLHDGQSGELDMLTLIASLPELTRNWYVADAELLTEIMGGKLAFIADKWEVTVK